MNQQHFYQTICKNSTGTICGNFDQYCNDCPMRPIRPEQIVLTTDSHESWQKCPICNGTAQIPSDGFISGSYQICPVCNGKRIISTQTGNPPIS